MTDLPPPPVPIDCDLRSFPYLPLDVVRLRDSRLASTSSGDEFRAAVLLWCASWHQVPAASLPNDDRELASLAGYGRDVKGWRKVREQAMRGWYSAQHIDQEGKPVVRLYHPVVVEKATEAWRQRQMQKTKAEKRWGKATAPGDGTPAADAVASPAADAPAMQQNRIDTEQNRIETPPSPASSAQPGERAAANLSKVIESTSESDIRQAIASGDPLEVLRVYGANMDRPREEWTRDTQGMQLGVLASILNYRAANLNPVREPSGLRRAREEWGSLPREQRTLTAAYIAKLCQPVNA